MTSLWRCRDRSFKWGDRTLIMGIVNVTPDSFSDGGLFYDKGKAIEHAYRLIADGADIIDAGGASTRPGADPVPEEVELQRVLTVVQEIAGVGGYPVSIDTFSYEVAARCLEAGACVINDVTGLQNDLRLANLAAESGAGLILMHMRGTPRTMQSMTDYENLTEEIRSFFARQVKAARQIGVSDDQIVLDPGIGFSKTADQNLEIIQNLDKVRFDHFPLLLGPSRKSFIGKITGAEPPHRLYGTIGAAAVGIMNGADIVRVHDVKENREAALVVDSIKRGIVINAGG
ncbi:MAG: dihydropteroate synthase [Candidatus Omnitrophica bacterium]|nr:dihydropteroate synthase [Candidatus Omnitrophota bacterium]